MLCFMAPGLTKASGLPLGRAQAQAVNSTGPCASAAPAGHMHLDSCLFPGLLKKSAQIQGAVCVVLCAQM
jgi:hypothetical protein